MSARNPIIHRIFHATDATCFAIAGVIWLLYFLPYFFLGEHTHLPIADNMDSNIVWAKIVLEDSQILGSPSEVFDRALGGVPRSSLYWYDLRLLSFQWFGMFWGYVFNKILMSIVAFGGMYLLLRKHLIPQAPAILVVGSALLFSWVPFWSFTMSSAGIPLVVSTLLTVRKGSLGWKELIVLIGFAFFSSLVLSGFFLLLLAGFVWLRDMVQKKPYTGTFFLGLTTLAASYMASHIPLFYAFFLDHDFVSHREEFIGWATENSTMWKPVGKVLLYGHFEVRSLQMLIWVPVVYSLGLMVSKLKVDRLIMGLLAFLVGSSFLFGVYYVWELADIIHFLHQAFPIHLYRFFFLHPAGWYVLLALTSFFIYQAHGYKNVVKWAILGIFLLQLAVLARHHEHYLNRHGPSFKQFYATSQWDALDTRIGKPKDSYKIMHVGMLPAPALYNGFHTVDGYFANYPLAHKHAFQQVIQGELAQSADLTREFTGWGSRCYGYTAELGRKINYKKRQAEAYTISSLAYDWDAAKAMDVTYLVSGFPIDTLNVSTLRYIDVFQAQDSYWDLYLYSIK